MTGQIPKYGENFLLQQLPYAMGQDLASRRYVLKADRNYYIRSNRSSEKWTIYVITENREHVSFLKPRNTLKEAMELLLSFMRLVA
jgi:hypothetical protein